jgi:hypothetical protein
MKQTIEIEVPEGWEVDHSSIYQIIPENINIPLKKKPPRRMVFEEIIGATGIYPGQYFTNESNPHPVKWSINPCKLAENNTTIWRRLDE